MNQRALRSILLVGLLSLFAGCATSSPAARAASAIGEARALFAESYAALHGWSAAMVRLASAEKALASGDHATALGEAEESSKLSRLALEQARAEADASTRRYPFAQ